MKKNSVSPFPWVLVSAVPLLLVLVVTALVGCANTPPQGVDITTGKTVVTNLPQSTVPYVGGHGLPTDPRVYHITGTVIADGESVVRQVRPASGSVSGGMYGNGYGYMSGTFSGEVLGGKTLIRLQLQYIDPADTDWITVNPDNPPVVLIKAVDTKAIALYVGDTVSFTCRRQAEAVEAINQNEYFDSNLMTTWELDYCRLSGPVVMFQK